MRRVAMVLVLAVALAACSDGRERREPPTVTPSSSFRPSAVSIAPPPSAAWVKATTCPTQTAARAAFGPATLAQQTNDDVGGTGCVYRLTAAKSVDVMVIQGTAETNRAIFERPPPSIVRDAPELAPGAIVVYTPPDVGVVDQCLVAVDHPNGTLTVQVSDRGGDPDRQRLCAPLAAALRLLAAR